jgi:septal ring factor EnvC (AmiA/AmiB activator)
LQQARRQQPAAVNQLLKLKPSLMKKLMFILCVSLTFGACHNYQEDLAKKEKENQELIAAGQEKDSTVSFFINEVNDIEANLAAVDTSRRNVVTNTGDPDLRRTQITKINDNIANIKSLMQENKERLAALNKKLKNSGYKIHGLEKMIATLTVQIAEKDSQLLQLNNKITELNTTVSTQGTRISELVSQNEEKQRMVDQRISELNTAYYVIGTSKDLLAKGVLTKEGGFIGLGKSKVMNGNVSSSGFTQIDITQTTSFPLNAKSAKVVTTHPASSYTIGHPDKKHVSDFTITDPAAFWRASKYLIITVDK